MSEPRNYTCVVAPVRARDQYCFGILVNVVLVACESNAKCGLKIGLENKGADISELIVVNL